MIFFCCLDWNEFLNELLLTINMSYKVLIYSCHTIIQVGLSFCVKKSIANASIFNTSSLEHVYTEDLNYDLFVFNVSQFTELYFINSRLIPCLKDKKVVFLIEDIEIEKLLNFNTVTFIHKENSELEIIKSLRALCKIRKPSIRYRRVSKRIQKENKFSKRELQCANLFMKGYSVSQISKELSLKMNTISTYKKRLQKKTNSNNLVQLINTLYKLKN